MDGWSIARWQEDDDKINSYYKAVVISTMLYGFEC